MSGAVCYRYDTRYQGLGLVKVLCDREIRVRNFGYDMFFFFFAWGR